MSKTLHTEGDWVLYPLRGTTRYISWIWHECKRYDERTTYYLESDWTDLGPGYVIASCNSGVCIACDASIPEGIHGLWKLHNFEWIQKMGAV